MWSGRVGGLWSGWLVGNDPETSADDSGRVDWWAAAKSLKWYLNSQLAGEVDIIAHSHGGQVAALAVSELGVRVRNLVTVSTPVRTAMRQFRERARRNLTGTWVHVHGDFLRDYMARLGRLGPGWCWQWTLEMPEAHNVWAKGHGHSTTLNPVYLGSVLAQLHRRNS